MFDEDTGVWWTALALSDAPDPDLPYPHHAHSLMALGVGGSSPVYRIGSSLHRLVLGPVSLVRLSAAEAAALLFSFPDKKD